MPEFSDAEAVIPAGASGSSAPRPD